MTSPTRPPTGRRTTWIRVAIAIAAAVALVTTLIVVLRQGTANPSTPTALTLGAVTTVPIDKYGNGLEMTKDGRLFVARSDHIIVLDARTYAVLGRIGARSFGTARSGIVASSDGERMYVHSTSGVEIIDLKTNLIGDPVVGREAGIENDMIGLSEDGRRVFGIGSNSLAAVDLTTGTRQQIAPMPTIPRSLVLVPDGSKVYVPPDLTVGGVNGLLKVIDTASGRVSDVPGTEGSNKLALAPDGRSLYTIGFHGVIVLDSVTGEVVRRVASGLIQGDIAVVPGGRYLLRLDLDGTVELFDMDAGRGVATVPVGKNARDLLVTPDGRKLFVTSEGALTAVELNPVP